MSEAVNEQGHEIVVYDDRASVYRQGRDVSDSAHRRPEWTVTVPVGPQPVRVITPTGWNIEASKGYSPSGQPTTNVTISPVYGSPVGQQPGGMYTVTGTEQKLIRGSVNVTQRAVTQQPPAVRVQPLGTERKKGR